MKPKFVDDADTDRRAENYGLSAYIAFFLSLPSLFAFNHTITPIFFLLLTLVPVLHISFISKRFDFFDPLLMVSLMYAIAAPIPMLLLNERLIVSV